MRGTEEEVNVSNRDVLIDYILGRLSRTDAEAVEEQARVDSGLAQTLGMLRRELADVGTFANLRDLPRALNRRLHDSSTSRIRDVRSEMKDDDSLCDKNAPAETVGVEGDFRLRKEDEKIANEESSVSSVEEQETDSWGSLFSEAFASFADENAKAQERADAKSRKIVAKKAEIKPAVVVPHPTNERPQALEDAQSSNPGVDRNQANETQDVFERNSVPVSLYDVEVRTASRPIRRRKRFEFIPKSVQAPTNVDASGLTFKRPVALSLDEQGKKRRKNERFLEASAPVLGERVAFIRASLDFVDSVPDFSSSLNVRTRILRSKLAFNAAGTFVDDSVALLLHGWRDSSGLSTYATIRTPAAVDEQFVVSTGSERGNFALCRGTIPEDLLDADVLTPYVETTRWTVDCVDAPDAYLMASLPYAPSASDVERVLPEDVVSANITEETTAQEAESFEYSLQEIEEVPTVSEGAPYSNEAIPHLEAEFLEKSAQVDDSIATSETAESVVPELLSATEQTEEFVSESLELTSESETLETTLAATASSASEIDVQELELAQESAPTEILPESETVETTFVATASSASEIDVQEAELAQESATLEESALEGTDETLLENALIVPQQTDSYYASDDASAEDAEEYGPTLSAEDRRLAELLGHTPTPLELDEFYWEDLEDSPRSKKRSAESNAAFQLLGGVLYVVTAPVVLVGRATLGIGGLFLPRRYERTALKESQRSSHKKQRKSEEILDVAIPCVAGVLIAIFVVFPFLLRSIDYAARSIGGNVFRRISGKVAVPSALEGQINATWSAKVLESQLEANGENASVQGVQTNENDLQLPAE